MVSVRRTEVSFLGTIGTMMTALKLKEKWDGYNHLPADDEEGRVTLDYGGDEEGLLETEPPLRKRRKGCCSCCLRCALFWKALAIASIIFAVLYLAKFFFWAATPARTGLEDMPEYSTSFACSSAEYIYTGHETTLSIPVGLRSDHAFDTKGDAVGTIVIAEGADDATEVVYKMTIRTDDVSLLDQLNVLTPTINEDGTPPNSRVYLVSPRFPASSCMRYDVTVFVPPNLLKLHIATHAAAHVKFDSQSSISLQDFYVTLYSLDKNNMILPSENIKADKMSLEVYNGWIVGEAAIVNTTSIITQRGSGIANVNVHPTPDSSQPVSIQTTSGSGRTDLTYIDTAPHRPIHAVHMSSGNGDMYLTYTESFYSGRLELSAPSFTVTNAHKYTISGNDAYEGAKWTHYVGDEYGGDRMTVKSLRGWAGLYF